MSQKDDTATRIAELLGIRYAHAVRLIRDVNRRANGKYIFSDLAHACRELKEQEEAAPKPKRRKRASTPTANTRRMGR